MNMITVIGDAKTGYVDQQSSHYQLGAYSMCKTYLGGKSLPHIDEGLILKVNDMGCTPMRLSSTRLAECRELFLGALRLYKDAVRSKLIKPKANELYPLSLDEGEVFYPRVTSILKVLNREGLNQWLLKQSITYTLKEMKCKNRTPDQVLDAYEAGLFQPTLGAFTHRDKRGGEGTDLHRLIRNYLTGKPVDLVNESEFCQKAYPRFETWAKQVKLTLVDGLSETKIINTEETYAGTLDFVATMEN